MELSVTLKRYLNKLPSREFYRSKRFKVLVLGILMLSLTSLISWYSFGRKLPYMPENLDRQELLDQLYPSKVENLNKIKQIEERISQDKQKLEDLQILLNLESHFSLNDNVI